MKCCRCNKKRKYASNEILFREFNIDNKLKREQEMDALMESINTKNVDVVQCEYCQTDQEGIVSYEVFGTPKFIFILTGIVKKVKIGCQQMCRKSMNFKMKLEECIIVEDTIYILRTVVSHIGDNSHIQKKVDESGHYICYRQMDNSWYCFNDGNVEEVVLERIGTVYDTEKVNMLVYEKN
jgi:ubiquitin C-terminal hydrolase